MPEQPSMNEVIEAVQQAQRKVKEAQSNQEVFSEAQNQVNFAEDLIMNIHLGAQHNTIEDKHQLQQATDLLRLLQETQHANRIS